MIRRMFFETVILPFLVAIICGSVAFYASGHFALSLILSLYGLIFSYFLYMLIPDWVFFSLAVVPLLCMIYAVALVFPSYGHKPF